MELEEIVSEINTIISKERWMDMEILRMKGNNLTIMGSIDFTYGHSLEITFEDVYHMSINMIWRTDTSSPVLKLVEGQEAFSLNRKYTIEQGNTLFKIMPEDIDTAFYIAAKGISYNTDKVYYYKREDLASNERIADWVE